MYQVACEVFPPTNSADYGRLDYAVAVVFADRTNAPDAEAAARDLLKHEGWELEEVLYVREARLEDIDAGLPAHAAFELALKEGVAVVYHEVPLRVRPFRPPDDWTTPGAVISILDGYSRGLLSPDEAAKRLIDEMRRHGQALNLQLDVPLREALEREQRRRDGAA